MSPSPTTPAPAQLPGRPELLALLWSVPDPRDRRGVRHQLPVILAVGLAAVLTGARSFAAIGEWVVLMAGQSGTALIRLGVGDGGSARRPTESTIRRAFARVDADLLDRVIGAFVWTRTHVVAGRRVIALDGKTVRGARTANAVAPHLVAAFDHATGTVVGQVAVAKSNEIPSYQHGTRPARLFRPDRCRRDRGRDTYPGRDQQPSAGDHRRRRGLLVHGEEEPAHAAPGVHGPALGRRPQLPGHPPADIHEHAAG